MRRICHPRHDVLERVRDLAVAVELVTEDVRDHEHVRIELLAYAPQRPLVAFDGSEPIARLARDTRADRKLRRDALDEVCATTIIKRLLAHVLERLGNDVRRRRLSVGSRDYDGAHATTQAVQILGVNLEGEFTGQRGATPSEQTQYMVRRLADECRADRPGTHGLVLVHRVLACAFGALEETRDALGVDGVFDTRKRNIHGGSRIPKLFKTVIVTRTRLEDMHDDRAVIHKHPFALVEALDARWLNTEILEELLLDFLGNRINTTIVSCRADYEVVGDVEKA